MYIYELKDWPHFSWKAERLSDLLSEVSFLQGNILGRMQAIGFTFQQEAFLNSMTDEITKSCEIEGELIDTEQVRSSIARRLNISGAESSASSHHVDGLVEMMFDAVHNYDSDLTMERLLGWHAALFPTGYSGMYRIKTAALRDDKDGPMQVVSSEFGRDMVYYEAPPAGKLPYYMNDFLNWINSKNDINPVIKAGVSHLWFITLHPFEDGNGRIARAVTDMMLAKAEKMSWRFYSMSAQIQKDKKEYYTVLENTQKGSLDITVWLEWFLRCLLKAITASDETVSRIIHKSLCWQEYNRTVLNTDQKKMINMLLDGFKGNLTSGKWAVICKCSQDTAIRSIKYLMENNILQQKGAGRSTHYVLNEPETD